MINKANSQSKQFKSLLQSQLALYENFDADFAVDQMVQAKLQAVKKAEPVLETKAENVAAKTEDVVTGVNTEVTESREEPVRDVEPQDVAPQDIAKTENVSKTEQEPVKDAAEPDRVEEQSVEKNKEESVEPENLNAADKVTENSPRPLFSRFRPRNSVVFNRNGFPRKNADLRVALSELQKSAETKSPSSDANPESAGETGITESQTVDPKPEENKES